MSPGDDATLMRLSDVTRMLPKMGDLLFRFGLTLCIAEHNSEKQSLSGAET